MGFGAVERTLSEDPPPDVPEPRRGPRRIGDRERARQGATPDRDRGERAVPAVRRDARTPHAVDPELRGAPIRRPGGEPDHLADQERIAPRYGVGRGELAGRREVVPGERAGDRYAPRGRARARPQLLGRT